MALSRSTSKEKQGGSGSHEQAQQLLAQMSLDK